MFSGFFKAVAGRREDEWGEEGMVQAAREGLL